MDAINYQLSPTRVHGGIRFRYFNLSASSVNIAGKFNNWDTESYKLEKYPCGIWEIVIPLDEGVHEYKFVVDNEWTHDPSNPCMMLNGLGGVNSVVEVRGDIKCYTPAPHLKAKGYGKLRAVESPKWVKDSIIYEIFPRVFSPEGTLNAIRWRIPEIYDLGVTCIWLMPIHPIGVYKRKGILGSPYAISDYRRIHPDIGTVEDLRNLVRTAHAYGIRVIMDFVANHSAADCYLKEVHPNWYKKDAWGKPQYPGFGWTDVIGFDYNNRDLRNYMIETMLYYIRECDIDGYRCDVAALVPNDFWCEARDALKKVKPDSILLAESHEPSHNATSFDLTYEENLPHILRKIFFQDASARKIQDLIEGDKLNFPIEAIRMRYLENHDQPRAIWQVGKAGLKVASTLLFTLDGVPLIYNGQEIGEQKRIPLFDPFKIQWGTGNDNIRDLYKRLSRVRKSIPALRRGSLTFLDVDKDDKVIAYYREYGESRVMVILNFTADKVKTRVSAAKEFVYKISKTGKLSDVGETPQQNEFPETDYLFTELLNDQVPPISISKQELLGKEIIIGPYEAKIYSINKAIPCRCIA